MFRRVMQALLGAPPYRSSDRRTGPWHVRGDRPCRRHRDRTAVDIGETPADLNPVAER